MKFLRVGNIGAEKPALLDNNIIRDLSSVIKDIDQTTIGDNLINTIKKLDISKLPQLDNNLRIGACLSNPTKFLGIGLNFLDHFKILKSIATILFDSYFSKGKL